MENLENNGQPDGGQMKPDNLRQRVEKDKEENSALPAPVNPDESPSADVREEDAGKFNNENSDENPDAIPADSSRDNLPDDVSDNSPEVASGNSSDLTSGNSPDVASEITTDDNSASGEFSDEKKPSDGRSGSAVDNVSSTDSSSEDSRDVIPGAAKKDSGDAKTKKENAEPVKEQKVNYELLSREDLADLMEEWLSNKGIAELGEEVNEINEFFQKKHNAEIAQKKESFLKSGGLEQDFKPVEDPAYIKMQDLMEKYKSLKAEYNKQLESTKEENLAAKNDILEQFRILMEKPEAFDATYRKFKQLQKKWFDIGIVPRQNVRDLWNSYNFFVEKFNDYVNINKELRHLDYKKNLDQKLSLCEKAEQLANEKNIVSAFRRLQKFHSQWREIGPVPIEDKDKIWERFKAATSIVNKSHQAYQVELKASLSKNYELKQGLCEKAEALANENPANHNDWVQKTNELLALQKEWKTIGYAPKKVNNQIYSRFRQACDLFFDKKAEFYAKNLEKQKEHLEDKKKIVDEAERLKDNTDWKATTDKLINLQKKWNQTGPVPNKESDKLWKQFRAACDHFFKKKSDYFGGNTDMHEENLNKKEQLIEEVRKCEPTDSIHAFIKALQEFQKSYFEIGFVPIEQKDQIRDEFKASIEGLINRSGFSSDQKNLLRFRIKIIGLMESPRSENKLNFEREKLMSKLQQLRNDIIVLENNVGFFKQTESSEDTISDFQDKIADTKNRIKMLEDKVDIIDELDPNG